jgi:hypothetical protein
LKLSIVEIQNKIDGDNKKADIDWKNGALCCLDLLHPNHSTGTVVT